MSVMKYSLSPFEDNLWSSSSSFSSETSICMILTTSVDSHQESGVTILRHRSRAAPLGNLCRWISLTRQGEELWSPFLNVLWRTDIFVTVWEGSYREDLYPLNSLSTPGISDSAILSLTSMEELWSLSGGRSWGSFSIVFRRDVCAWQWVVSDMWLHGKMSTYQLIPRCVLEIPLHIWKKLTASLFQQEIVELLHSWHSSLNLKNLPFVLR